MEIRIQRLVLAASLAIGSCCWAQETAQITGRIVDATGSVAPGAEVEIRATGTNSKWDVRSNGDGYYTQALLPPGEYRVSVRLSGFKQEVRTLTLEVQQISRLDFTLQVGTPTETIEVVASSPMLESSNASVGQVIETQAISDLPLNGRNYLDLAKLSMGVVEPAGNDQAGTAGDRAKNGGSFVANGTRSDMNNFILDGIDNNAKIVDLSNNTNVVIQPSVDALMEFKVETNTYSAEYGHSAGAVVNATIRSGANNIHGTVFEFLRNDKVDARNFFLPATDATPELRRNQYGATLGGSDQEEQDVPVRKLAGNPAEFRRWYDSRNTGEPRLPRRRLLQLEDRYQRPYADRCECCRHGLRQDPIPGQHHSGKPDQPDHEAAARASASSRNLRRRQQLRRQPHYHSQARPVGSARRPEFLQQRQTVCALQLLRQPLCESRPAACAADRIH